MSVKSIWSNVPFHLRSIFPYLLSIWIFCHCYKCDIKVPHYYWVIVNLSSHVYQHLPYIWRGASMLAACKSESCSVMSNSLQPHGLYMSKPKNTGVGSLSLLQQILLAQESNWGLLHCRQILCQLSYQGSSVGCIYNVGCIYTYNCYIFFLDRSFDHYVMSFLVSCNSLFFSFFFNLCGLI